MSVITSFPARMLISFIPLHIETLFHLSQEMAWNPQVTIQLKCIRYESRQWNISDMNSDDGHLKMARNGWTGNKTMGPLTWWWHREALWLVHYTLFWPLIGCTFCPHIPDVIVSHRSIVLYPGSFNLVTGNWNIFFHPLLTIRGFVRKRCAFDDEYHRQKNFTAGDTFVCPKKASQKASIFLI